MPINNPPALTDDCALFLDLDGTLIDIAPHPIDVVVPPDLKHLLKTVRDRLGGALALVSGRSLAQIDLLLGGYPFDVAGSHGFELRDANGRDYVENHLPPAFDRVAEEIITGAKTLRGLYVERKAYSIAIHYRTDPALKDVAWGLAQAGLDMLGTEYHWYRLQGGKAVVELIPVTAQKGVAVERFMETPPYRGRIPVFVGDDLTDETGFDVVNRLQGIAIRIGDATEETHARFGLSTPTGLRGWLASSS